ncbi:MAG: hypothetical protein FJ320_05355 [SAR202 cluster bacterium]|nr:hypothetical protein [SAR202 cluster bacterium]
MAGKMTILLATNGQGTFRSADSGKSWTRSNTDHGMHSDAVVRALLTDPHKPSVVLAGTDQGLYRSDDAGIHWKHLDTPLTPYSVWNLAQNPKDPKIIYAGTGTPSKTAIFRSDDGGKSWKKLPVAVPDTCPNVGIPRFTGLAVDPVDPNQIWAGIEVDGVRYSKDGGESWQKINGVITNPDVHSVAVVPGPPKTIVIVVNNGIFTSINEGKTWKGALAKEAFPMNYPRCIATQPGHSKTVFIGLGDYTPGSTGTIIRSKDAGKTWENLTLSQKPNTAIWAIGMHEDNPKIIFAASRYGDLYRSDDGGDSWAKEWREFSEATAVTWVPV